MAFYARRYALPLFLGALAAGCGHLGFVELPLDADDGGPLELDAAREPDAAEVRDGPSVDSSDAGCAGPSCSGTFVSGATGKDTNPGTATAPVQTITKGISIAVARGGKQNVYVAASHYSEKVTLAEQVDVLGGYECSATTSPCTWARDVAKNNSQISAIDFEGVLAPKTVTRKTLLDGLRIVGKGGAPNAAPGSVALTLNGGTPTIRRCEISGADTNGGVPGAQRSIAVQVLAPSNDAAGALLEDNTIISGAATDESIGVLFDRRAGVAGTARALAVLTGNTIQSGTAPLTNAVYAVASGAATLLQDNDITAGTSSGVGAGNGTSWGITVMSEMTIDGNRINVVQASVGSCVPNGQEFCGGIRSLSSTTFITNNVVLGVKGPRTCAVFLTEAEKPAGLVVLNANTLDGAGTGGLGGTMSAAIALRIAVGTTAVIGSVRNNILLGGTNASRYGVYEESTAGKTARTSALDNNDFWNPLPAGPADFAYRKWNGSTGTNLLFAQLGTVTPVPTGNIGAAPLLDKSYHLLPGSPCIDTGTPTEAPPRDFDGDKRPNGGGIDIGADEAN